MTICWQNFLMYINETHILTKRTHSQRRTHSLCETKLTSIFLIIIRNILDRLRNTSNAKYCRDFLILCAFILSKRDEANMPSEIYHCNLATIYIHNYLRNRKFPHFTSLGILDSDRMYRNIGRSSQKEGKTKDFVTATGCKGKRNEYFGLQSGKKKLRGYFYSIRGRYFGNIMDD